MRMRISPEAEGLARAQFGLRASEINNKCAEKARQSQFMSRGGAKKESGG
jgi:hypothetical protein